MGKKSKRKRRPSPSSSNTSSSTDKDQRVRRKKSKTKRVNSESQDRRRTVSTTRSYTPPLRFASPSVIDETLIPEFSPGPEGQRTISWVTKIEELAKYYNWNDCTIVRLATNRLRGNARKWYDSLNMSCLSWCEMKKLLIETFPSDICFGKLLCEAANYKSSYGQNLSDYCFEKISKLRSLGLEIPEKFIVDSVLEGITDINIQLSARAGGFVSIGHLVAYLNHVSLRNVATNINNDGTSNLRPYQQQRVVRAQHDSLNRSFKTPNIKWQTKQTVKPVSCFNCGENHRIRSCNKPIIKCEKCNLFGHTKNACKSQNRNHSLNKNEVNLIYNKENIYVKTASINTRKLKCLIDTGSTCTLMKLSVARDLKLRLVESPDTFINSFAGNTVISRIGTCAYIHIEGVVARVNIIIVDDQDLKYDLLVGTDYLNQPHVIFLKYKNNLILRTLPPMPNYAEVFDCNSIEDLNFESFNTGSLNKLQKDKLIDLLTRYRDCISFSMRDLGKTDAIEMHIQCTTNDPIVYRPYRMSMSEKEILNGLINELLENKIIRESRSPYASPILLVKKKTGDYRMCVDYRKLNAVTVKDKYPLPLIEDQLDKLGGNKYFISLDLASGFYQVPMAADSIEKTAFITPQSHYEFLRMPFGLANSPAVFQRLINNVLGDLRNQIALPYMDDILIPCKSFEQGLERLQMVLETLRKNHLTLKPTKCSLFQTKIDYLGREVSAEGVRPGKRKIDAVLQMKEPENIREVRQFLGLSGFFRKFVNHYANIVEPLSRLLRKATPWVWSNEQHNAVVKIKKLLTERPILAIFDPTLTTELHTDASAVGFGAMLVQFNGDKRHVVAYYSKKTTPEQSRLHSYELETLSVVMSLRHFRIYLLGIEFTVFTDCNALRTTLTKRDLIPRVARWWLEVQEFNFSVKYRPGHKMSHVDALSRNPISPEVYQIDVTQADWILAAQLQDEQLCRIRDILRENKNNEFKQYYENYKLKDGKVYRKLQNGKLAWVVPKGCRWQICKLYHDEMGHFALEKTIKKIQENYWFASMRHFVSKYVRSCLQCLYYKHSSGKKQGMLHPIEKTPIPFHTLHMDHLGPFVTSKKKNKYLLVVVDGFTKFVVVEPVKDTKTKHVIKVMYDMMYLFGAPTRIITDRGTAFTAKDFQLFCENYGIKHILNAVASPRANGQCERYNRTILNALATSAAGHPENKWDEFVKSVQSAINCTFNKATNASPIEMLAGYTPKHISEARVLSQIQTDLERIDLPTLRSNVLSKITEDQKLQKIRFDKTRALAKKYQVGDVVLVMRTGQQSTGDSRKLVSKFKGPFRVRKVLYNDRYEVEDLRENVRKSKNTVVAVDKMKPWIILKGKWLH